MHIVSLFALAIFFPSFAFAVALININTADATLLDTLPGIGPTKAAAIIDYRTTYGPFARIEDIQNVSGIGVSTYADIAPLITVGDTVTAVSTASSTESTSASGGATTYTPPPTVLSVDIGPDITAYREVPFTLTALAKTKSGAVDPAATIYWSFGDGSATEGRVIEKTYHYIGTYLVVATAKDGTTTARDDLVVVVKSAVVRIASVTHEGIILANDTNERLELSGWRLVTDTGVFRLPEGTMLLQNASALFPYTVMNLSVSSTARLTYPNGIIAAQYVPAADAVQPMSDEQPSVAMIGYTGVREDTPLLTNTRANIQNYETAAVAPTKTVEPAFVGAALASFEALPETESRLPGILRSPWTLSFLGIMALAGSAFIFL
ncbi:hypothetical protein A2950_00430 [Candidatus Kaiserbacteria bacterium RIFCSPLOWO2_01_FULL_55_19]|uniref:PKD domain-containing protein n=1 Tax=Candidatus Kaiserbacteria bacterium RIFCSPLOWO2_01_FULL_55_19 TaxID=1798516 RepID=A0A1F6ESJ2_9BACT|nr:MAG: hypothetical protein A2950_00430 [Candidatus Kaiserbacteria bacterium RIFCSPLOWO2_01_FULL_55_19]